MNQSFSVSIGKFVENTKVKMNEITRKVVFDMGTRVMERTPVGDASYWKNPPPPGYVGGHARANWSHSDGILVAQEYGAIDKTGQVSMNRIRDSVPKDAAGRIHYLSNSVPYIIRLEDGYSRQAPNGMVSLTVAEFEQFMKAAAGSVK